MNQPYSRNASLTPSDNLPPDHKTYPKYYRRKGSATWTGVTIREWRQLNWYDLWQVDYLFWGYAACAEIPIISFPTVQHEYKARRKEIGIEKDRRLAALNEQAQRLVSKTPTNIDEYGWAWGSWMRFEPNGWYSKNQLVRYEAEADEGRNSTTRAASIYQYSGDKQSSDVGYKTGDDQKDISKYSQSTPLIRHFMPAHIIPYHVAWKEKLSLSHQAILWAHYVLIADHTAKLHLLNVTDDVYKSWLASAQRKIDQDICELPEPAPEPPEPTPGSGPLWSCRILASIHKSPIRHSGADTESLGPVLQFPRSALFDGFRMSVGEDENDNYIFRLPGAEIYAILAKRDYNGFLPDEAREFLDFAFDNMTLEICDQQA